MPAKQLWHEGRAINERMLCLSNPSVLVFAFSSFSLFYLFGLFCSFWEAGDVWMTIMKMVSRSCLLARSSMYGVLLVTARLMSAPLWVERQA